MSDKVRITLLAALVVVLALVWWIGGRTPLEAEQRSFPKQLLAVDTAALRSFTIIPAPARHDSLIQFQRDGLGWTATQGDRATPAFTTPLNRLLAALVDMRPRAVAGADAATIERYGLSDSLANTLVLRDPKKVTLRIGTTSGGDDPATAVILDGDPNVYLVPGAITWIMDLDFIGWIPKPMVNGDPDHWERITFVFPGSVGYSLERSGTDWIVNGQPADNVKVEKYLRNLSIYYGRGLEDPNDTLHARLIYSLRVEDTTRKDPIILGIFDAGGKLIARSTLAPPWLVMPFDVERELHVMFRPPEAFQSH
ncbi:MAG: DUF4340 domain-containing protein [Flavobacteriales bacterium]|jgi:hypothetical protein|nr:DUF4340 domain-containing protein [Flavobacteriales bacterium]